MLCPQILISHDAALHILELLFCFGLLFLFVGWFVGFFVFKMVRGQSYLSSLKVGDEGRHLLTALCIGNVNSFRQLLQLNLTYKVEPVDMLRFCCVCPAYAKTGIFIAVLCCYSSKKNCADKTWGTKRRWGLQNGKLVNCWPVHVSVSLCLVVFSIASVGKCLELAGLLVQHAWLTCVAHCRL